MRKVRSGKCSPVLAKGQEMRVFSLANRSESVGGFLFATERNLHRRTSWLYPISYRGFPQDNFYLAKWFFCTISKRTESSKYDICVRFQIGHACPFWSALEFCQVPINPRDRLEKRFFSLCEEFSECLAVFGRECLWIVSRG